MEVENDGFDAESMEPRQGRRSNWIVGGIALGTVAIVGAIVALTTNHATSPASSHASSSNGGLNAQVRAPIFPACHPGLCGLHPFVEPGSDASVEKYTLHTESVTPSHYTKYHVEAEVVKDVHRLDKTPSVLALACNQSFVNITFNSSEAANSFSGSVKVNSTLMPILAEWGCGAHVRRVGHNVTVSNNVATVHTLSAKFQHMFKSANISFNGTRVPGMKQFSVPSASNASTRRDRRSDDDDELDSLWNDAKSDVTSAFDDITETVADVEKVASILASGNYSADKTPWTKSMSKSQSCGNSEIGDLTTCSFDYDAQLTFMINIVDYEVTFVQIEMNGNANAGVATNGQSITKSWNGEVTIPGFDSTLFATIIEIGPVPVPVSLHGKMTNVFNWDVTGSLQLDGEITVGGDLTVGGKYTPEDSFVPVFEHDLNGKAVMNYATGSVTTEGTITSSTTLVLSAMFAADLSANLVVTPTVTATGTETVEGAGVSFNKGAGAFDVTKVTPSQPDYSSPCHPQEQTGGDDIDSHVDLPSLSIGVAVGVDVSAAAKLDIEIESKTLFDKTWPIDSYSNMFKIAKWCFIPKSL